MPQRRGRPCDSSAPIESSPRPLHLLLSPLTGLQEWVRRAISNKALRYRLAMSRGMVALIKNVPARLASFFLAIPSPSGCRDFAPSLILILPLAASAPLCLCRESYSSAPDRPGGSLLRVRARSRRTGRGIIGQSQDQHGGADRSNDYGPLRITRRDATNSLLCHRHLLGSFLHLLVGIGVRHEENSGEGVVSRFVYLSHSRGGRGHCARLCCTDAEADVRSHLPQYDAHLRPGRRVQHDGAGYLPLGEDHAWS